MIRLVSGVMLAAAALAAILLLPVALLRLLAAVVAALAAVEYLRIVKADVRPVLPAVAIICWLMSGPVPATVLALLPLLLLALVAFPVLFAGATAGQAAAGAFSVVYISVPLGMLAKKSRMA